MKTILEILGGFCLVAIGITGLILPIMPGWIFLIPGLVVLARHFDWAKRLVGWAKEKAEAVTGRPVPGTEKSASGSQEK